MEYTCEDCTASFPDLAGLAAHCKVEGHYDAEVEQMKEK